MPIFKLPDIYDSATIFHVGKEQLQKRLEKKLRASKAPTTKRNPFKITERFIRKYNLFYGSPQQEKFVVRATQLLCHSQRRAGLRSLGEGEHVNLPLAWTELLLLGLCHGHIQDDALASLLMSLDHAPMEEGQIPVLFYLAESLLYWITSDPMPNNTLFSCDVKMIKLGYLVFLRLFLFHMSGSLGHFHQSKAHLQNFLKALRQCELCYQPFPNLLFSVQFMLHTGEAVCDLRTPHINNNTDTDTETCCSCTLNPVLWQCLLAWYSVKNDRPEQLPLLAQNLLLVPDSTYQENWVYCVIGLMVLGEASKSSVLCLHMLLDLFDQHTHQEDSSLTQEKPLWPWMLFHAYCFVVAEVCLQGDSADIKKAALLGRQTNPPSSGGLIMLLHSAFKGSWQHRYSTVQALRYVWRGLSGATLQEEMRNCIGEALEHHLRAETDQRVKNAIKIIEVELRAPEGCLDIGRACCDGGGIPERQIGRQLAHTLSQLYLPPAPTKTPLVPKSHRNSQKHKTPRTLTKKTRVPSWPAQKGRDISSTKQGFSSHQKPKEPADFNTRTENELMSLVEEQWQKELRMMMVEEVEEQNDEEERRRLEEEQTYREMMRKRKEKVRKDTKPYELPIGYGEKDLSGQPLVDNSCAGQLGEEDHLVGQLGEEDHLVGQLGEEDHQVGQLGEEDHLVGQLG